MDTITLTKDSIFHDNVMYNYSKSQATSPLPRTQKFPKVMKVILKGCESFHYMSYFQTNKHKSGFIRQRPLSRIHLESVEA